MLKLKKSTTETIEEIHNTFFNAGERLIEEANRLIETSGVQSEDKVKRLEKAGFKNSVEVKRWSGVKVSKELADLVTYYKQKYPFNKFITDEQVKAICKKYNLICAPTERFTGFVPESNLKQIEGFNLKKEDVVGDGVIIREAWNGNHYTNRSKVAKNIHKELGVEVIQAIKFGSSPIDITTPKMGRLWIEKYDLIKLDQMLICAPQKDFDMKGLKKVGSFFASLTTVTVPDPVVLQPCKGGYLILAAWGEEASDPIVVNEINN